MYRISSAFRLPVTIRFVSVSALPPAAVRALLNVPGVVTFTVSCAVTIMELKVINTTKSAIFMGCLKFTFEIISAY
jgi:hypothetical protein